MKKRFSFEEYKEALTGACPKLKNTILDRAMQDQGIGPLQLKELVDFAYPDFGA